MVSDFKECRSILIWFDQTSIWSLSRLIILSFTLIRLSPNFNHLQSWLIKFNSNVFSFARIQSDLDHCWSNVDHICLNSITLWSILIRFPQFSLILIWFRKHFDKFWSARDEVWLSLLFWMDNNQRCQICNQILINFDQLWYCPD